MDKKTTRIQRRGPRRERTIDNLKTKTSGNYFRTKGRAIKDAIP
jgi:hypothetical protein